MTIIRWVFFCILGQLILASSVSADTKTVVKTKDGKSVTLVVTGKSERIKPQQSIVICSDGSFDDVGVLRKVAATYFPAEAYDILNANGLSKDPDLTNTTIAYFGSPPSPKVLPACLNEFPALKEYVELRAALADTTALELNSRLKKQFSTNDDVIGLSYCAPGAPIARIDGRQFNWSVHLRGKAGMRCMRSYIAMFGVDQLCLTKQCPPEEEEKLLQEFE
jgi:hypothetical protein